MNNERWVYRFDELTLAEESRSGSWDGVRALLGGKGANLGSMTRLGVPVPPGFTITTEACNRFLADTTTAPPGMWEQVNDALQVIQKNTNKVFGDPARPLLLSCRSGAKFSMPGMMDTVLDIGLNDEVVKGLADFFGDEHFTWDSYRRLIQMFSTVVLGLRDELFEDVLSQYRILRKVNSDADLTTGDLKHIVTEFKALSPRFPEEPEQQLRLAIEAVFRSWNGKRANDYRNAAGIAHNLGTAVNIQTMVFGNMGEQSGTGVCMSRNPTTGENHLEGDYLTNAQGEDVVSGTRVTNTCDDLAKEMPKQYKQLLQTAKKLEQHYREMQDMEFTIERGKLWLLQTRDGKRTAQAAVRIAVEMADEGLISWEEALQRVKPEQVDFFLHPQFSEASLRGSECIAEGLNVSPGAAVGMVAFDADLAEKWAKQEGKAVIMVRPETKPDDVHGMLAANGIVTSRGGRTSHAALVARQFGKPAVVGVETLSIDLQARTMSLGDQIIEEGAWLSIDGSSGNIYSGKLETMVPDIDDPWMVKLLTWADDAAKLEVRANADYPGDAERARKYGARGLGLVRTEHMFFETERLPIVQKMILAESPTERRDALDTLLPYQRKDFTGLFRAMDGLPVIIRLIDPPLHEFLPAREELQQSLTDNKIRLTHARSLEQVNQILTEVEKDQYMLSRVESLHEENPMLGTRGVRLGILFPELPRMQVRAIFEAACEACKSGCDVKPEIMIPLTSHVNELARQREILENEAKQVMQEQGVTIDYMFGSMIEIPRAALIAAELVEHAEFFSFGTNDLTQTTYGISRDDAERGFLLHYLEEQVLDENPFATLDRAGVGRLMKMAVEDGRKARQGMEIGICGEHGGDPASIALCNELGLSYVSCSPFRVPIARLAAAQAALAECEEKKAVEK